MHRRAQARAALVAALAPVNATIRVAPAWPDEGATLPSVTVLTGEEEPDEDEATMHVQGERIETRHCSFALECRLAVETVAGELSTALDALALEVEQALGADETLGGEVRDFVLTGTSGHEIGEDVEVPVGLVTLVYQATYRVSAADPQDQNTIG